MLWNKLMGANAAGGLEFVGGVALGSNSTGIQSPSFDLTGLTGGIASSPASGDIVICAVGFENGTDLNITCTTSGYTEVADLYQNASLDAQLGVYYKVLSSAETSVAFNLGAAITGRSRFVAHVWRFINTIPQDAQIITAKLATKSDPPNAPATTTATPKAVVIAIGYYTNLLSFGSTNTLGLSSPSGMENFFTSSLGVRNDGGIGIASAVVSSPSSYDPQAFGFTGSGEPDAWCAATIALRPE